MTKKDPFADDEAGDERVADKAATDSLKDKIKAKREAAGEEEALEVDVDRAEEDLGDDLPEPQKVSRQEKRRNRYRELQEERDAAQRERQEMSSQLAQMRQMLEMSQRQAAPPPPPEEDPLDKKLKEIFTAQDMLYRDFQSRSDKMSPAEVQEFNEKSRQYQRDMMLTTAQIAMKQQGVKPVDEEAVRQQVLREQLVRDHADVIGDPAMQQYFQGAWIQLRAKGRPDDWSTINEAADRTRVEFGRRPKTARPPSESYKRKLTGMARGGGGGDEDRGSNVVTMNSTHKRMADAAFPHIKDEKKRYQLWAAGPGRRLQKQQTG